MLSLQPINSHCCDAANNNNSETDHYNNEIELPIENISWLNSVYHQHLKGLQSNSVKGSMLKLL
jgi:hypothetical protein